MPKSDREANVFFRLAFKYFLPLPVLFGGGVVVVMVLSGATNNFPQFGCPIVCGILVACAVILFSADRVGRRAAASRVYGPAYGVLLLLVGAATFSSLQFKFSPGDYSIEGKLIALFGWIVAVGFPMAIGAGFCFSDACNRKVEERKQRASDEARR